MQSFLGQQQTELLGLAPRQQPTVKGSPRPGKQVQFQAKWPELPLSCLPKAPVPLLTLQTAVSEVEKGTGMAGAILS